MTTLETEEYRKERDRLELRKITLVQMSNAFKTSDKELASNGVKLQNGAPSSASYSTIPPPPPPPRTNMDKAGVLELKNMSQIQYGELVHVQYYFHLM